jgi:PTH1 family peptidyl-tRNA hydrolase
VGSKKLIVGLGNPGPTYQNTRHNAGFMLVDLLAQEWEIPFGRQKHQALYGRGEVDGVEVILIQPQTFMNRSGDPVAAWAKAEGLDPQKDLLVACDDLNLALGHLRFRPQGSSGAHNGLASLIERLGGPAFARLRLGIGRTADASQWADYVLEKFSKDERKTLNESLERAVEGCKLWVEGASPEKIMSAVNAKPTSPPAPLPKGEG